MERKKDNQSLDKFELEVLRIYQELSKPNAGIVPSNKEIAHRMEVSRNAVARARRRIAHKLDIKRGW